MIVILSSSLSFFLSLSLLFLLFLRRFAFFSVVFSQPPARKRERTERKIPDFKTHFVFRGLGSLGSLGSRVQGSGFRPHMRVYVNDYEANGRESKI